MNGISDIALLYRIITGRQTAFSVGPTAWLNENVSDAVALVVCFSPPEKYYNE